MEKPFPRRAAANPTQYNIDAIAKLEHEALDRRTLTERVSDLITKLVGNVGFLLAQQVALRYLAPRRIPQRSFLIAGQ
jgi:uncharacterized membrane protein